MELHSAVLPSYQLSGQRLCHIADELGIEIPRFAVSQETFKNKQFNQMQVGDIAEELAKKKIVGAKDDFDYMEIIRYYPEQYAFDELKNAWCAAFVYHCCIKAGLTLPLRTPNNAVMTANYRLVCVFAWYDWGMEKGYCYFEKDGYVPKRGDIVIYNNIIHKDYKPENSTLCDHIGIVIGCNKDTLMVAEGNVNNKNVSGIVERLRDETIGCYISIPCDYEFDGWMIDYKTGKQRVENYD